MLLGATELCRWEADPTLSFGEGVWMLLGATELGRWETDPTLSFGEGVWMLLGAMELNDTFGIDAEERGSSVRGLVPESDGIGKLESLIEDDLKDEVGMVLEIELCTVLWTDGILFKLSEENVGYDKDELL